MIVIECDNKNKCIISEIIRSKKQPEQPPKEFDIFFVGEALHILKDICIRKPPADSSNNLIWNDRLYFLRKKRMNNNGLKHVINNDNNNNAASMMIMGKSNST